MVPVVLLVNGFTKHDWLQAFLFALSVAVGLTPEMLPMSQSCVSQHLQKLRSEGILSAERTGNEVYYRVTSREAARIIAALLDEEVDRYAL